MKLGIDVNRHKEIIVKAISALLLLLLKHFKLNHIYQVTHTQTPSLCPPTYTLTYFSSSYMSPLFPDKIHTPPPL